MALKVKVTNRGHPITNGVTDSVVTDEQHYMTYDKDRTFVLLGTVNEKGLSIRVTEPPLPEAGRTTTAKAASLTSPGHETSGIRNTRSSSRMPFA
jgi:hypothetical protein